MSGEPARVDAFDYRHTGLSQPLVEAAGRAPIRSLARELAHHHAANLWAWRFHVVEIDAVVADHRRRHHHDLAEITRVGECLLIASEVGGEDDLTESRVETTPGRTRKPG